MFFGGITETLEKIDKMTDTVEDIHILLYNPDLNDNLENLIKLI